MEKTERRHNPCSATGDSGLAQYLLVVYPDSEVSSKVLDLQKHLCQTYCQEPQKASVRPYIEVAVFQAPELMEETFIRWIQRICSQQQGFSVTLNNFGAFPPYGIYLRIMDPEPFCQLARQLQALDDFIGIGAACCPPAASRPQLPLAGELPVPVYDKAIADFSTMTFHESFGVSELVLLKRNQDLQSFKTVNVFRFRPGHRPAFSKVA